MALVLSLTDALVKPNEFPAAMDQKKVASR